MCRLSHLGKQSDNINFIDEGNYACNYRVYSCLADSDIMFKRYNQN